jgi:hypothetical protein
VSRATASTWRTDYGAEHPISEASAPTQDLRRVLELVVSPTKSPFDEFRGLVPGWDGRRGVPPNEVALEAAEKLVRLCIDSDVTHDRIVPFSDGGLAVYFFGTELIEGGSHRLVARVAFDNDGATTLLLEDLATGSRVITDENLEDDPAELIERIRARVSR